MRKLINSIDISLDGVVEKHLWPRIERFGDEGTPDDLLFSKGPETQFNPRDVTSLGSGVLVVSYELA
jgi:hypothetical protein